MDSLRAFTFIIFGGTGDLAIRKLIPALYNLYFENKIKVPFNVIGISRKKLTYEQYRDYFIEGIKKFSRNKYEEEIYRKMADSFYYISGALQDEKTYQTLSTLLKENESDVQNRLFYLAINPAFFPIVVKNLTNHHVLIRGAVGEQTSDSWHRVIIEKPFGSDLQSARTLNNQLANLIEDAQMFRIDHYLGKEAVQNFMVLRFANGIFEPLWNNKYIDHIQITVSETVGVGKRGAYYENAGATKDMLQNHILQLLALLTMEPPIDFKSDSIATEKVKVIRALTLFGEDSIVRGQYEGYRAEDNVNANSIVETFVAAKLGINNWRWAGVPIYVRTGKHLTDKITEVIVQFNEMPYNLYKNNNLASNKLVISIEPETGFSMQFNIKEPTKDSIAIRPVEMNFCHECEFGKNTPEAYERLIIDAVRGDASLFTSWKEIEYSWMIIESIMQEYKKKTPVIYKKRTWGPCTAQKLIKKDGREWYHADLRCDNADS